MKKIKEKILSIYYLLVKQEKLLEQPNIYGNK